MSDSVGYTPSPDDIVAALEQSARRLDADPAARPTAVFRQQARARLQHAMNGRSRSSPRRLPQRLVATVLAAILCGALAMPVVAGPGGVVESVSTAAATVGQIIGLGPAPVSPSNELIPTPMPGAPTPTASLAPGAESVDRGQERQPPAGAEPTAPVAPPPTPEPAPSSSEPHDESAPSVADDRRSTNGVGPQRREAGTQPITSGPPTQPDLPHEDGASRPHEQRDDGRPAQRTPKPAPQPAPKEQPRADKEQPEADEVARPPARGDQHRAKQPAEGGHDREQKPDAPGKTDDTGKPPTDKQPEPAPGEPDRKPGADDERAKGGSDADKPARSPENQNDNTANDSDKKSEEAKDRPDRKLKAKEEPGKPDGDADKPARSTKTRAGDERADDADRRPAKSSDKADAEKGETGAKGGSRGR